MREDMFKVIVTRPRWGHRHAPRSKMRYDKCPDRQHVTGRRMMQEAGHAKHLNENLAPLKRFLHKQKGRKWDDVFSEICQHLDTGSTVKMHVREHLQDFIYYNTKSKPDGSIFGTSRWGGYSQPTDWYAELYVDPKDGIIKETRKLCKKLNVPFSRDRFKYYWQSDAPPEGIKHLQGLIWHVRISGIWYEVELSKPPLNERGFAIDISTLYANLKSKNKQTEDNIKIRRKHQFSKKELKALKLSNSH